MNRPPESSALTTGSDAEVCELEVCDSKKYNPFGEHSNHKRCALRGPLPFQGVPWAKGVFMIRKLKSGQFRLYSRKKDDSTGKRRNLGTFSTIEQAKRHEREVQYFKKH
jgi:hypothetical protein